MRAGETDGERAGFSITGAIAAFEPEERPRRRMLRLRRLETVDVPQLRLIGSLLLALAAAIHIQAFPFHSVSVPVISVVLFAYAGISWLLLYAFYEPESRLNLAVVFLVTDVVIWTWVIGVTGGPSSWLFFTLLLRPADQASNRSSRALWFGVLSALSYFAMLLWLRLRDGLSFSWPMEGAKLLFLLGASVYLAMVSRRAEMARRRRSATLRSARAIIAGLREREEALRAATARAEELNQAKSDLLAVVSHEIRNPLNGILGMAQVSLHSGLPPEQKRSMELIKSSAEWLLGILNQILDFSRIEARKLDLIPSQFDLRDRLRDWMKTFGSTAQRKGLDLHCWIGPEVPRSVVGDEGRLRQVLENLVGNAIKFTSSGQIVVSVAVENRRSTDVELRFSVTDTGPGIPEEVARKLFEPYQQGEAGRLHGGTGLGLSIARRVTELMGGRLWMERPSCGGTEFAFIVRLWLQQMAAPSPEPLAYPEPRRAALLIRSATGREHLEQHLRYWGFDVSPITVEKLPALCASFGLFLIDSSLEGESAFQAAETLLGSGVAARQIVMLLASAADFRGSARAAELGLDNVISRPVMPSELAEAVSRASTLDARQLKSMGAGEESYSAAAAPLEVLVIDDEAVNREVMVRMVESLGHGGCAVATTAEAVELLAEGRFDVILMDLHNDGLSLEEAAERIRDASGGARLVAVTGDDREDTKRRCRQAAFDGFLLKPLSEARLARSLATQALSDFPQSAPSTIQNDFVTQVLAGAGGSAPLAQKISLLFLGELPAMQRDITDALAARDASRVALACHKLKGSVSNFGHHPSIDALSGMEKIAIRGSLDQIEAARLQTWKALDELQLLLPLVLQDRAGKQSASSH